MFSQASVILFTGGCLPQYMLGYTPGQVNPHDRYRTAGTPSPSPRRSLQRTVRILLECFLVFQSFNLFTDLIRNMIMNYPQVCRRNRKNSCVRGAKMKMHLTVATCLKGRGGINELFSVAVALINFNFIIQVGSG